MQNIRSIKATLQVYDPTLKGKEKYHKTIIGRLYFRHTPKLFIEDDTERVIQVHPKDKLDVEMP